MNVYRQRDGGWRRVGSADVPDYAGPVLEVPMAGRRSVFRERYTIGTVTHLPAAPAPALPVVERAVLLADGQPPELLPGWAPLDS